MRLKMLKLWLFKNPLGVGDVVLDRRYQCREAVEVLLRPQIADDADFQQTSVEIPVEVVQYVSFLREIEINGRS